MEDQMNWTFSGYKTYLAALGIIVAAAVGFGNGELDLLQAVTQVLEGFGLAALRMGVKKIGV